MKKRLHLILLAFLFLLAACGGQKTQKETNTTLSTSTQVSTAKQVQSIDALQNTEHFNNHALEHIFLGTINRQKEATGFHYEGLATKAKIIESTRSKTDSNGIYRARITVEGTEKKAMSSFFPKEWTAQQVVDAINTAYQNKKHVSGNIYEGKFQNITIQMYLTDNQKIISAFPIYQK